MQENYVSLDPVNADSMTLQQRRRVWSQRFEESLGGKSGNVLGMQYGLTAGLVSYASLKRGGFTLAPMSAAKTPQYAGILFSGYVAYAFGVSVTQGQLGDRQQQRYLQRNKRAILSGEKSMDQ